MYVSREYRGGDGNGKPEENESHGIIKNTLTKNDHVKLLVDVERLEDG